MTPSRTQSCDARAGSLEKSRAGCCDAALPTKTFSETVKSSSALTLLTILFRLRTCPLIRLPAGPPVSIFRYISYFQPLRDVRIKNGGQVRNLNGPMRGSTRESSFINQSCARHRLRRFLDENWLGFITANHISPGRIAISHVLHT